ncbi:MAG: exodeoxyribonuclease VII large subunit [Oscillospiraceae bacterium]|jgi:exodeoxyribonuclease VII large subunit|nr:exodeoxyribonuclease VII large subunit [Oscillospiraceae bacterium]
MTQPILSVSDINQYIKAWMDGQPVLARVLVRGEVSNYRKYPSGHHYFTLKDAGGVLRAVMFRTEAASLRFVPEDGMTVVAGGRVSVFPRDGQYQIYCTTLSPEGIGDLTLAFEQLKKKLLTEGLFDGAHKKPLPRFPRMAALITSPVGAAVRDMLRIMERRWPLCRVLVAPVRVQGEEAAPEICRAIAYVNRHRLADVIIVGRGGGSMEDLWAFNEESVARAIFASEIPVVSAVGHEPDVTIADFVADVRAATPTHAAELVTPDQSEWRVYGSTCAARLNQTVGALLRTRRERLASLAAKRVLTSPAVYVQDRRMLLDLTHQRLVGAASEVLHRRKQGFVELVAKLDALSPLSVLTRGYAIATGPDGRVLKEAGAVRPGDPIRLRLMRGEAHCIVQDTVQ